MPASLDRQNAHTVLYWDDGHSTMPIIVWITATGETYGDLTDTELIDRLQRYCNREDDDDCSMES